MRDPAQWRKDADMPRKLAEMTADSWIREALRKLVARFEQVAANVESAGDDRAGKAPRSEVPPADRSHPC